MLRDLSMDTFIEELASKSPAPGGGSAAALAASLSSALSCMVFNLTVGKKIYNEYDKDVKELINRHLAEANDLKNEFLTLMDKDSAVFLSLMDAFKLPKETEAQKKNREEKIQEGFKAALEAPMEVAIKSVKAYDYIFTACDYGNPNTISDAGVSALMLHAALESAILNVKINLANIKDEEFRGKIEDRCETLIKESTEKRDKVMAIVNRKINN